MELRFDFADDDSTTGFRLEHFELYNWGTYDKKIVKLELNKSNALLTGDIGSGKSTIVDAITTLIVPHNKIVFNKAAGASTKERTIYTYVIGEYKSTQDENFNRSKAISLRDESSFSVILGRFENSGFDESLTLAQFFYISNKQIQKFFIISRDSLSIKRDFFNFNDIRDLKKRLKSINHTQVFDTLKDYSKTFTRAMGIKNAQALNLFYQTVSLKAIGDLTEFIRKHMLEPNSVDKNIDELCQNFAELNHAHNLILDAIKQIELLDPIKVQYQKYNKSLNNYNLYVKMRDSLGLYMAGFEYNLLGIRLKELDVKLTKQQSKYNILKETLEKINDEIYSIKSELDKNGASRMTKIDDEVKQLNKELQTTKSANEEYNKIVKSLGYTAVSNEHRFLTLQNELKVEYENIEGKKAKLQNQITIDSVSCKNYKDEIDELEVEILYLKHNRSNIPQKVSKIRDNMAKELGIDIDNLPFVGELIEVKDKKWQGAIQRVLHNISLSLLVDYRYYQEISNYVEKTNLRGRIVYLKVDTKKSSQTFVQKVPNSILDKIEIKVDSNYYNVVTSMLNDKFNISCVENLDDFRRFKKALSLNGQYKSNLTRHEKDDRYNIDDKSRWTLGWNNLLKLQEFEQKSQKLTSKYNFVLARVEETQKELESNEFQRDNLRDLLKYNTFNQIDWYRFAKDIEALLAEKEELLKSNDIILTLQNRLELDTQKQKDKQYEQNETLKSIGEINQKIDDTKQKYNSAILMLENNNLEEDLRLHLDQIRDTLLQNELTLNNISISQNQYHI